MCRKDAEDKEKTVPGIRDDEIRKDGVGSAAVTDKAQDEHLTFYRPAIYEINDPPAVISMDMAVSHCATAGAGFEFRSKRIHVGVKEGF